MAGLFGRIFTSWFAEHATDKLAQSAAMQALAARAVAAQDALGAAAAAARANPEAASEAAKRAVASGAETFFTALRREIAKDLGMAAAPPPRGPPPPR